MTTVESSSELQISEENDDGGEGIDRLSTLPDSILLHILSFIPTKTTVQTITLVSQRFSYLWKDIQVFHFSYYSCDSKSFKRFSDFVNGVFTLRTSRHIRKIHLDVSISHNDSFVPNSIETWIRAAMGPYLEELTLYIHGFRIPIVDIPSTLFNSTNLVSLSLCGAIPFERATFFSTISFPSLKVLRLDIRLDINSMDSLDAPDSLEIIDPDSLEIIIDLSGCPVLQTLEISDLPDYIWGICVPPSLKRFEFYFYGCGVCPHLEINAPGLQYLNITTSDGETVIVVGNLQSVVEAYINVFSFSPLGESQYVINPLLNLLRALCGVKKLELPCLTTESLLCEPVLDFPEFCYLLHLDITIPSFNSNFLLNMLEKCPMLQDLKVMRDEDAPLGGKWELQSTKIPNCLVSHLTSIHIGLYRESQDELLEFAEYILLNGLILKTMFIDVEDTLDLEENDYILRERLSYIKRGSPMCQIKFIKV